MSTRIARFAFNVNQAIFAAVGATMFFYPLLFTGLMVKLQSTHIPFDSTSQSAKRFLCSDQLQLETTTGFGLAMLFGAALIQCVKDANGAGAFRENALRVLALFWCGTAWNRISNAGFYSYVFNGGMLAADALMVFLSLAPFLRFGHENAHMGDVNERFHAAGEKVAAAASSAKATRAEA
jgi:hypothetical protein